jgi:DNA-binding CsgD family transcriptional regulator
MTWCHELPGRRRADLRRPAPAVLGGHRRPWAGRARGELRASGETTRRRDPERAAQLTPQEHQVAELVAARATSRQAAARLFLGPRTIDAHLRSIYAKLGISSRGELRTAHLGHRGFGDQ